MPETKPLQPGTATTSTATSSTTATATAKTGVTVEDVLKVCPDASKEGIAVNFPLLVRELAAAGLTSKNQLVAAVATAYTETGSFKPIPEYGKGNGEHGAYYGRGLLQLTHEENYAAASKKFGVDLLKNPDLALQPELSAKIFVWYWKGGTGLEDMTPFAEKGDWRNVRAIVNAGHSGARYVNGLDVFMPCIERG